MSSVVTGEMLKAAREAASIGLSAMATRTHFSLSHLSNVEAGRRAPTADLIAAYEQEIGEPVDRRSFLALPPLAVMPELVAPHVESGRIGSSTIARLVERTARLRQMDNVLGGADTYRTFLGELESSQRLAKSATYDEVTGRALFALIAEQAQQAGWSAFDAGWQERARKLYELSREAATEARDDALTGNALAFLAYQRQGSATDAVEIAAASVARAGPAVPGAVRALLLERLAWAYAIAGEPRETERALDAAHEALAREGQPSPDWAAWVDASELQIMTGRCWAQLRQPGRAIPVLENVLSAYPDLWGRDKALYLTWLAEAYRDAGEVEQAAAVLSEAQALSADVASVRPRQRITDVAATLAPYGFSLS
ncbi:helix-turn-helix domain-containing protein [Catenulispora sp. NF23]|uniref:helix-turn-helix domain-containing protein n=1 Tax=Catenulispora pinistramenti TaxID=2705254 RepID=UPI001BAABD3D|nr:helix-turn-helix transcriptional regulator [Catenulispora pinistramenti]MBS2531465.1 helix-turn-helix domain-containing protein [Catenulispora pinistramenti]